MAADPMLVLDPPSKAAGARLFWRYWPAAGQPKAAALLSHGYAEHLGRYEYLATAINRAGYDLFALDHWGHGRSDGVRGYAPAFSVYLDGVAALIAKVKAQRPDLPRVLIGHSMGGLIAASVLVQHQDEFRAAALSGPSIRPVEAPPPALLAVSRLLSAIAPRLGVIVLDAGQVSRDPAVVAAYVGDPLVHHGKMSARLGAELFSAMQRMERDARAIKLPILIMHGEKDGLAAVDGSRALHAGVGSRDKTLKVYDGLFHEIFNEPERDRVIADMIAWLDARL